MPIGVSEFLASAGAGSRVVEFRKSELIFSQGDSSKTIFYIQKGTVKLSFLNQNGKEAVLALLGPDDFFGEGCLGAQASRFGSATAVVPAVVLAIERVEMIRILRVNALFAQRFIAHMLSRNIRSEENLIDQLMNSVERRLARALLLLARSASDYKPEKLIDNLSQELLAEMIGTTRPRVNFFMNKFRALGLINYNSDAFSVNDSLLRFLSEER